MKSGDYSSVGRQDARCLRWPVAVQDGYIRKSSDEVPVEIDPTTGDEDREDDDQSPEAPEPLSYIFKGHRCCLSYHSIFPVSSRRSPRVAFSSCEALGACWWLAATQLTHRTLAHGRGPVKSWRKLRHLVLSISGQKTDPDSVLQALSNLCDIGPHPGTSMGSKLWDSSHEFLKYGIVRHHIG